MTLKNGHGIKAKRYIRLLIKGTNDAERTLYDEFSKLLVIEKLPQILHSYNIGQDTGLATKQTHPKMITLTLKHRRNKKLG